MKPIYEDDEIRIEIEPSHIPWLKIFTVTPYKEMSQAPEALRTRLYEVLHIIEKEMIDYFRPDKINIASFGNYVPHLHWHIMARFRNDAFFPEPMWGEKQREAALDLPPFEPFYETIARKVAE